MTTRVLNFAKKAVKAYCTNAYNFYKPCIYAVCLL